MPRKTQSTHEQQSFLARISEAAAAIADAGEAVYSLSSSLRQQDLDKVIWESAMPRRLQRGEEEGATASRMRVHAREEEQRSRRHAQPRAREVYSSAELSLRDAMRDGDMEAVMRLTREVDVERVRARHMPYGSDSDREESSDAEGAHLGRAARQDWEGYHSAKVREQPSQRSRVFSRGKSTLPTVGQEGYTLEHARGAGDRSLHMHGAREAVHVPRPSHHGGVALDHARNCYDMEHMPWSDGETRQVMRTQGGCGTANDQSDSGLLRGMEGRYAKTGHACLPHPEDRNGTSPLWPRPPAYMDDRHGSSLMLDYHGEHDRYRRKDSPPPERLEHTCAGQSNAGMTQVLGSTSTMGGGRMLSRTIPFPMQTQGEGSSFHHQWGCTPRLLPVDMIQSNALGKLVAKGVHQLCAAADAGSVPIRSGEVTLLSASCPLRDKTDAPHATDLAPTASSATTDCSTSLEDVTERPHSPREGLDPLTNLFSSPPSPSHAVRGRSEARVKQREAALQVMREEGKVVCRVGAISILTDAQVKLQLALRGGTATAGVAGNDSEELRRRLREIVRSEVMTREAAGSDDGGSEDEIVRLRGLGIGRKSTGPRRRAFKSLACDGDENDGDEKGGEHLLQSPDIHKVERIIDVRTIEGGGREFLIKWQGWSARWNGESTCRPCCKVSER